jgi:hypothetical protein
VLRSGRMPSRFVFVYMGATRGDFTLSREAFRMRPVVRLPTGCRGQR